MKPARFDAGRRGMLAGGVAMLIAPRAFADAAAALPGGGAVNIPSPYRTKTDYPNRGAGADPAIVAYRNWRSTMSGYPECDGLLAVARSDGFRDLRGFTGAARLAMSINWGDADRVPKDAWTANEKRFQPVAGEGANGPELISQLSVHVVGFFDVYDKPAAMYAVRDRRGVDVGVWIYDSHGGLKAARRIADRIAASFKA